MVHLRLQVQDPRLGLLLPLSLVAMFVGSVAAIYQTDLKRLLAYSSIAQIGYMTLALSMATTTGLMASRTSSG